MLATGKAVAPTDSRIPGFYRLSLAERQSLVANRVQTPIEDLKHLLNHGGLTPDIADKIVENSIGTYALPFGLALNFCINDIDRLVPMVVEEPSVIAAASNAARIARMSGGFIGSTVEGWMTGQIEVRGVEDTSTAIASLRDEQSRLFEMAAASTPGLTARGGGPREFTFRDLGGGILVVHIHVDCKDAMGANLVNTIAEAIGPEIARVAVGRLGLRILTNLCDRRRFRAQCRIPVSHLATSTEHSLAPQEALRTGSQVAIAIEEASHLAEIDPYRASTHNKGIMNGVDAVVMATGNDTRAVEAGAHAWAAQNGQYGPLARWHVESDFLFGRLEMPLALGTVGGTLRVHPTAQWALSLLGVASASELSEIIACVGLATNFSALRVLATSGIQRGHMSLHARSVAISAGAGPDEVEDVARLIVECGHISEASAKSILRRMRVEHLEGKP